MPPRLAYVIKFVADMDRSVRFHRDTLGLPLKFQSPHWSEFVTGETTLALHQASSKNPPGTMQAGFSVADLNAFHQEMTGKGVQFPRAPAAQEYGGLLAEFADPDGALASVSGPAS